MKCIHSILTCFIKQSSPTRLQKKNSSSDEKETTITVREKSNMMMNQMITSVFDKFLFPPPPSILLTAMSVFSFVSLTNTGVSEIKGKHLQYSKFRHFNGTSSSSNQKPIVKNSHKMEEKKKNMFSGRNGMLFLYTPAFLVGVLSFWVYSNDMGDLRFLLVNSALTIHFFKRVFEVLFVHKYSGGMVIDSAIPISLSYFISTASMIYNQHLLQGVPEPSIDLKYAGVVLFSVSILGNFYHHYLLSKLRTKDGEGYKIPKGGLFNIIICPHYLFEILIFVGISLISQSLYPICFTVGTTMYLTGRSYATRKWYLSKFPNFPKHVKALIPFVY